MVFNTKMAAFVLSHICAGMGRKNQALFLKSPKNVLSLKLMLFNKSRIVRLAFNCSEISHRFEVKFFSKTVALISFTNIYIINSL